MSTTINGLRLALHADTSLTAATELLSGLAKVIEGFPGWSELTVVDVKSDDLSADGACNLVVSLEPSERGLELASAALRWAIDLDRYLVENFGHNSILSTGDRTGDSR